MKASENRMGTMPIGKLLFSMSLPPMVSMLAAALYNIIDSIFVAKVAEDAMTAVTLVFPIQMFMVAINVGVGVGLTSLISRRLGEKRQDEADSAATHGFVFAVVIWLFYVVCAFFLAEPFLRFFTGTQGNDEIFEMALTYCRIVMIGSVFWSISVNIERIMQSAGDTFHPMLFNLIGIGVNTVLAPIFIIGYFGMPQLGVAGAGYVAVIGQCVGCVVAVGIFFGKKHVVRVSFRGFRLRFDTIRDILSVGFPTFVMQAVMPVLISLLNKILFDYASAVFVLGVFFRISNFVILPVVGMNQGAMPVIGYSYGAKNRLRLLATFKTAFKVALIIMIVGTAIFWIFPERIMALFSATGETLDMGVHALRAISLAWLPGSFVIISIGLFQSLAYGSYALIISIVRQIGFVLPLTYILLYYWGIDSVWFAHPLSEIVALILALIFVHRVYVRDIKPLPDGTPVNGVLYTEREN
jgi:putative MATE family efflux protein